MPPAYILRFSATLALCTFYTIKIVIKLAEIKFYEYY